MSTQEIAPLTPDIDERAANSRSFFDPTLHVVPELLPERSISDSAYNFATAFYEQRRDVMNGVATLIIQRRLADQTDGTQMFMDMNDRDRWGRPSVSLSFDASVVDNQVYGWQLTRTPGDRLLAENSSIPRRTDFLYLGRAGWLAGRQHYTHQGAQKGELSVIDPVGMQEAIQSLATQPSIAEDTERFRIAKDGIRAKIADLKIEPGNFNYAQKVRDNHSYLSSIGFSSTQQIVRVDYDSIVRALS